MTSYTIHLWITDPTRPGDHRSYKVGLGHRQWGEIVKYFYLSKLLKLLFSVETSFLNIFLVTFTFSGLLSI